MGEVDDLLRDVELSGYQRIVLPSGRVLPGRDLSHLADLIFPASLEGKTVLDVGCYYGYFLHNAVERGARKAVGLEPDARRFQVASTLAPLWKGKVEVRRQRIEELETREKFDYVLFLRVLHHVADPIHAMTMVAEHCRGLAMVMFREPHDIQFAAEILRGVPRRAVAARLKARLQSFAIRMLSRDLGIIGIGATASERGYYFNQKGFRNAFLVHRPLFKNIAFRPTHKPSLTLAVCSSFEDRS
jgi:2-polyprenyl-3-methyl-5-hydroxy-6-metoxy-1,4-benzoquinol methylase